MKRGWLIFSCAACLCLSGCAAGSGGGDKPALPQPEQTAGRAPGKSAAQLVPERLEKNESGVPMLKVYDVKNEKLETLSVEDYLPAVLAGEMAGDWPLEALKAQAILARTFVLQFVSQKESMYDGADISTDIKEAQAYDAAGVNARIREAVKETRGEVLNAGGELPYAWFHAHSGGSTALAREGLGWQDAEPAYTRVEKGLDSPDAPEKSAAWEAQFSAKEFLSACHKVGADVTSCKTVKIAQKGPSGRAVTLSVDGVEVSVAELRLALGSTVMRSTLLTELRSKDGTVFMAGKGYGHGVGMPQWGAYALAQDGMQAADIATYYYENVSIATFW